MKKVFFVMSSAMLLATSSFGQNGLLITADTRMNENKLDEAAQLVETALTSGKTKNMAWAYNLAGNIQARIINDEITKATQNQPLDTTLFLKSLDKAIEYFTKSHDIDVAPDEKGKIKSKYYKNNFKMMAQMLPYYQYAGVFQNTNKNTQGAFDAFSKYLNLPKASVFTKNQTDSIYKAHSTEYHRGAYYASMLAYQMKKWNDVLAHIDFALEDETNMNDCYLMKLSSLLSIKDTAKWVESSKEAIKRVPNNISFAQNLLVYYDMKKLQNEAKATADEIVASAPNNPMAWYVRGCILLEAKNYNDAREAFGKAIGLDDKFIEANMNMGVSYINEVVSQKDNFKLTEKADREKVLNYYKQALPYFEKVRELAPDKPQLWANNLKTVYYNLENKEKEKEMDAILGIK